MASLSPGVAGSGHEAARFHQSCCWFGGRVAARGACAAGRQSLAYRIYAHGHESFYDALFEGLREYGYDEGRNLIVERRYARGRAELFKEFAAEMVRLNVDVVVVVTTPAALAVMNASKTIPIVHPNAIDPLSTGLIASLAHPGGNVTGGAQLTAEASAKRLEILKRVVPGLSRVAGLWNPGNPALVFSWKETQGAARALGLSLQSHEVKGPKETLRPLLQRSLKSALTRSSSCRMR